MSNHSRGTDALILPNKGRNSTKKNLCTHLCMSACNPGSFVQDTQLCRRRAGAAWTAAGGFPLVWDSGGSLKPRVPRRSDTRDDNLNAGENRQMGSLVVAQNYKALLTGMYNSELKYKLLLWQVLSWEYSPSPQASTHWPWWSRSPPGHKVHWDTEGPQQEAQELWQAEEKRKKGRTVSLKMVYIPLFHDILLEEHYNALSRL